MDLDVCDLKASLVNKILQFLPGSFARDLDGLISRGSWGIGLQSRHAGNQTYISEDDMKSPR